MMFKQASNVNFEAQVIYDNAQRELKTARDATNAVLTQYGQLKLRACQGNVRRFLALFSQIKKVEWHSEKIACLKGGLCLSEQDVVKLKELDNISSSLTSGTVAGVVAGGAIAFGAYSAVGMLATASTGTAIASLSGVAASNATLAFLGGGSLAAGGLGAAGGMMILGGFVSVPALAIITAVTFAKAKTNINKAYINLAEANKTQNEIRVLVTACKGIADRTRMYIVLLERVDAIFSSMLSGLQQLIQREGTDYSFYSHDARKAIAAVLATAAAYKAILDMPILDKNGKLTPVSANLITDVSRQLSL